MAVWRGFRADFVLALMPGHFPPPWSADEPKPKLDRRCFIVRDANGQLVSPRDLEGDLERRAAVQRSFIISTPPEKYRVG